METPASKGSASALAELLARPDGLRTARLLQRIGPFERSTPTTPDRRTEHRLVFGQPAHWPDAALPAPEDPVPIGPWVPKRNEGGLTFWYARSSPEAGLWSERRRDGIRAEKEPDTHRVCYLGESVATGWLLGGCLCPSAVLEEALQAALPDRPVEVIDLSRTSMTLPGLLHVTRGALQLDPDELVLFAGNNWYWSQTWTPGPTGAVVDRLEMAAVLREGGVPALQRRFREGVRDEASRATRLLRTMADAAGVPITFLVPAANEASWERRQPMPWLPGSATRDWHELYESATRALADGDAQAALTYADRMVELDRGLCSTSHRIACAAHARLGQLAEAGLRAAKERSAANWHTECYHSPCIHEEVEDVVRQTFSDGGHAVVSLREVLVERFKTPLPGQAAFVDYCHLTVEGIRAAMVAVAAALARRAELTTEPSSLAAAADEVEVDPTELAVCEIGSTVYASLVHTYLEDKRDFYANALERAAARAPDIAVPILADLARSRVDGSVARYAACLRRHTHTRALHVMGWMFADKWRAWGGETLASLLAVLARLPDLDDDPLDDVLRFFRPLLARGLDLAHPDYVGRLWETLGLERAGQDLDRQSLPIYRARWAESVFDFPCEADTALEIELTARASRTLESDDRLGVEVNGAVIERVGLGTAWSTCVLPVPDSRLRRGLNRIALRWPALRDEGDEHLARAAAELELGASADLFPVFGEVFSLRVRRAPPRSVTDAAQAIRAEPPVGHLEDGR